MTALNYGDHIGFDRSGSYPEPSAQPSQKGWVPSVPAARLDRFETHAVIRLTPRRPHSQPTALLDAIHLAIKYSKPPDPLHHWIALELPTTTALRKPVVGGRRTRTSAMKPGTRSLLSRYRTAGLGHLPLRRSRRLSMTVMVNDTRSGGT